MPQENESESKYTQQHLANERTYLAWIRTAVALVGLGFLAAGIVFGDNRYSGVGHMVAAIAGISSVLLGGGVVAAATRDYLRKREGINKEQFRSASFLIRMVFISLTVIEMLLIVLVVLMLYRSPF
ncbi:putative membrane protein [Paenibacillus sophorae]|nr:putative membrane protein [Paenibacillus sophorae]